MSILVFEKEIKPAVVVRVTQSEHTNEYQVSLNTIEGAKFSSAFNRDDAVRLCHQYINEGSI